MHISYRLSQSSKGVSKKKEKNQNFYNMSRYYIKTGLSVSKKNRFIYFSKNLFKMMKNDFYYVLKALIFKVLS